MPTRLAQKYDRILAFAPVSVQPRGDLERAFEAHDLEAILDYYDAGRFWVKTILTWTRDEILHRFGEGPFWQPLAEEPATFDKELERYTKALKFCMKLLWDIPDHAPLRNETRDLELVALRRADPGLSWGQLASAYNASHEGAKLTANQAERAFNRVVKRLSVNIASAMAFARERSAAANIPPENIFDHLPTPEQILAILAS